MRRILLIMIGLSSLIWATERFTRDANGVVTDTQTNLQWQDDYSDGAIKGATWKEAIGYCEALGLGKGKWRLPNKKELLSIVDYGAYEPSISTVFKNTASEHYYWSSTTSVHNTADVWIVYFLDGYTDSNAKTSYFRVRCVRAGQ